MRRISEGLRLLGMVVGEVVVEVGEVSQVKSSKVGKMSGCLGWYRGG